MISKDNFVYMKTLWTHYGTIYVFLTHTHKDCVHVCMCVYSFLYTTNNTAVITK